MFRSKIKDKEKTSLIPQSFLNKINREKIGKTPTEEIFNKETTRFYKKILKSRNNSPNITPQPSRYPSPVKITPLRCKNKRTSSPTQNQVTLPALTSRVERCRREKSVKIEKILKDCEETRMTVAESSTRLNFFVKQEELVTKLYTKEMKWTVDKIMEINGYKGEIMKTLYDEYKKSDEFHEDEKNKLVKKLNLKTLEDYKAKTKSLKMMMSHFRQKLYYE